jgi:cephalosporin-C deacetylase-like acetyl esterase
MNVNLVGSFNFAPSNPRSLAMAFSAPTAPDFLFDEAVPVRIVCQSLMRTVSVTWRLSRNLVKAPLQSGVAEPVFDGSFITAPDASALLPGFYDIAVTAHYSELQEQSAITTFGWRCDDEPIVPVRPLDFETFWSNAMDRVASTPLDLKVNHCFTLKGEEIGRYNVERAQLPERYDPTGERFDSVEVYKIDFGSPCGGRVHAWLARPSGEGPYPGMVVLPGAGNNPRPAPVEHARHGYAAVDVQVHGNPVDLDSYEPLTEPAYRSPTEYDAYRIYLNALQTVNALAALPEVDPTRLATAGGSQGGRLAYVVAGLDSRIRAAVPSIPHYCYRPWLRWTETMNAAGQSGEAGFTQADIIDDARTRIESYYDVINFVGSLRARLFTNAGLIDPVSPPTAARAAFRLAPTQKEFVAVPNCAHDWFPTFDRRAWRMLDEVWRPIPR